MNFSKPVLGICLAFCIFVAGRRSHVNSSQINVYDMNSGTEPGLSFWLFIL